MRGYIKQIGEDFYWYDVKDRPNKLSTMDTSHITNCVAMLENRKNKGKFPDNSSDQKYIDIFNEELAWRAQVRTTKIGRLTYV